VDGTSWGGRRNESADTASQLARKGTSRGGGEESRRQTWWRCETGACVWVHGKGSGPRASWGCGGRGTPARAGLNATPGWGEPDPVRGPTSTTPLGRGSGGEGGVVVAGTLSGGRAGPPSSWSTRDGRGRRVTQRGGCVAVGGVPRLEGARPLIKVSRQRTSTPPSFRLIEVLRQRTSTPPTGGRVGQFLKSRTGPQTLESTPPRWT